jgi:hypothetical protein
MSRTLLHRSIEHTYYGTVRYRIAQYGTVPYRTVSYSFVSERTVRIIDNLCRTHESYYMGELLGHCSYLRNRTENEGLCLLR